MSADRPSKKIEEKEIKKNTDTNPKEYNAQSIKVMEGLEAVRKRPAMYIGSTGPQGLHHLVYEVVDNSVDEALAGHCNEIKVILHADGSCSVEDNGRGIPIDIHHSEGISAAEVVLTKLHAGGKFDKDTYKYSGGLHGVGVSVVNALSCDLHLEVYKNGKRYVQDYQKGFPLYPLKEDGTSAKQGTYIRFTPDAEIFQETTELSFDILATRFRELAFLNKNLKISITDIATKKENVFFYAGGIVSFIESVNEKKSPIFPEVIYIFQEDEKYILELAMQYNDSYSEQIFSFVNNINTIEGGTHVSGFKSALTKACNRRAISMNILKAGDAFSSEDVREGLVVVISIKVPEPQFEGQTKTKLGNNEVKGIVDSYVFTALDTYFEENPAIVKKILQKAELSRRARDAAKRARDLTRRKTALENSVLPGKLADCSNEEPENSEIFIVEGDSAGGSAKQGRDRFTQAILPLKGKILNVEKARLDKMLANEEIKALISAIGCGIDNQEEFDSTKARYHRIILMTDADVDGSHIRTLLLTFFFRYMKPLIEKGYLYIAQPPLYKVKLGKRSQYLSDDAGLKMFLAEWAAESLALTIDNKVFQGDSLKKLLEDIAVYEKALHKIGTHFNVEYRHCHSFVKAAQNNQLATDNVQELIAMLQPFFEDFTITYGLQEAVIDDQVPMCNVGDEQTIEDIAAQTHLESQTIIPELVFTRSNFTWTLPIEFFASPEFKKLIELVKPLLFLEDHFFNLAVDGAKNKHITMKGVLAVNHMINDLSKPYMNIQRYKGLGEMNADQLWETAMDPKSRHLLQVSIDDALNADQWFTSLMGDDVTNRKKFIEENGRFVRNLDV